MHDGPIHRSGLLHVSDLWWPVGVLRALGFQGVASMDLDFVGG